MATDVPFPIRLAAGVVAAGLDHLRRLPDELPGLSVTVAGQAMRASMRLQQEITDLAGRGDEFLADWTSSPEEHPSWARFDDDEDEADEPYPGQKHASSQHHTSGGHDASSQHHTSGGHDAGSQHRAGRQDQGSATHGEANADPAHDADAHDPGSTQQATAPEQMPGYDDLRLAQLRARLRTLDAAAVQALLDYERAGRARASFVTTLDNRLTTLRSGTSA